ncbi:MAG TPA: dihydroorotate dehydrogenase electron transfer subunit [Thermoanaerobaculaceae bacterium]|nr:dihydroorotate dehydrogenase electron transfer subunit [Thermoanaerobaculaceae bacterium]
MIARRDLAVTVAERAELSPTCFRLVLETADEVAAVPGQFGMLACGGGLDPLLRRALSIAGVSRRGGVARVELMVKQVGPGTAALHALPTGTSLRFLAPLGNGFTLTPVEGARLGLVAGGIGLPPLLFAAERLASRNVAFDLLLGAATAAELLELDRCRAAVAAAGGELVVTTDDASAGEPGFVTTALERRLDGGRRYGRVLACGPNPMLAEVTRLARERGLAAELSLEEPMACGVGVCLGCVVETEDGRYVATCKEGPVFPVERLAARWWP